MQGAPLVVLLLSGGWKTQSMAIQGLSQDLETRGPKLAKVTFWGVHYFWSTALKGTTIYKDFNHKHV